MKSSKTLTHMSLRVLEKQSPNKQGGCFANCARNDMIIHNMV